MFYLQAKVFTRVNNKCVSKWINVAKSESESELSSQIPKGKEKDFRILNECEYQEKKRDRKKETHKKQKAWFGENLSRVLKENNITRTEASKLCGISRATMWTYFNSISLPSEENLQKICDGLGVSKSKLFGKR